MAGKTKDLTENREDTHEINITCQFSLGLDPYTFFPLAFGPKSKSKYFLEKY